MESPPHTHPPRLLLHACCGPCLIEPLDAFASEADSITVFFANPNISPAEEYLRRRESLMAYAADRAVDAVELTYAPHAWREAVAGVEDDKESRCRACYRLRLEATACHAAENGFSAISTTLYVSPYQSQESIREEGEAAARAHGVAWLHRDFRELHRSALARARDAGMHLQNYCGCPYSVAEAERSRAEARARRKSVSARRPESG
jgi:predicted adenine nucleotide alpha hydrolase (AANH) superfamily ATPase